MSRPESGDRTPPSLVEVPLTPAEVVELWSFLHGDIMEAGIRVQLRGSLGLCPRHTWGYAATEIELWQTGAGIRGGHQPFDVSVLYGDLLDQVTGQLGRPAGLFHHDLRRALLPRGQCAICAVLDPAGSRPRSTPVGYAGANATDLAAETNELVHTTTWCQETFPRWRDQACPGCVTAGGVGNSAAAEQADWARLCRLHLLDHPVSVECGHQVAVRLGEVAARLRRLGRSMTKDGPPATPDDDSSWVEALGWFAGWQVPLALARPGR